MKAKLITGAIVFVVLVFLYAVTSSSSSDNNSEVYSSEYSY